MNSTNTEPTEPWHCNIIEYVSKQCKQLGYAIKFMDGNREEQAGLDAALKQLEKLHWRVSRVVSADSLDFLVFTLASEQKVLILTNYSDGHVLSDEQQDKLIEALTAQGLTLVRKDPVYLSFEKSA